MAGELKPCPFCGGADLTRGIHYVLCNDCEASGPAFNGDASEAEAIAAWNRRAQEDGK